MKTMIIGLEPDYNYPGNITEWKANNTKYASNHGASLISRAIAKEFNAEFVNDFSDINSLNQRYDLCIIAFATHVTTKRDVSFYTDIVGRLDMKVVAFSMGVQDYTNAIDSDFVIHSSMRDLLSVVLEKSAWVGVRGPYTASILHQNGFKHVLPIGCPTLYYGLRGDLAIRKSGSFKKPLLVFHRTIAEHCWHLVESSAVLGQDFLDEAIFTNRLEHDGIFVQERDEYLKYENGQAKMEYLRTHGTFLSTFDEWFSFIGSHDFVFGPRLHGCIAALIQGIPAVMIYRDLRVKEVAEFFGIPAISYQAAQLMSVKEIYECAEFSGFNVLYPKRYNNYLAFLKRIGVESQLNDSDQTREYTFLPEDVTAYLSFLHNRLNETRDFSKQKVVPLPAKMRMPDWNRTLFTKPKRFLRRLVNNL